MVTDSDIFPSLSAKIIGISIILDKSTPLPPLDGDVSCNVVPTPVAFLTTVYFCCDDGAAVTNCVVCPFGDLSVKICCCPVTAATVDVVGVVVTMLPRPGTIFEPVPPPPPPVVIVVLLFNIDVVLMV